MFPIDTATMIPQERRLRAKIKIVEGKRIVPRSLRVACERFGKEIRRHEHAIKAIEQAHKDKFKKLTKSQRKWLRLQDKDTDYAVDVELDQILTYFRASLVHLYAYFIHNFLGGESLSLVGLVHRVLHLPATIEETKHNRKIMLQAILQGNERGDRKTFAIVQSGEGAVSIPQIVPLKVYGNKIEFEAKAYGVALKYVGEVTKYGLIGKFVKGVDHTEFLLPRRNSYWQTSPSFTVVTKSCADSKVDYEFSKEAYGKANAAFSKGDFELANKSFKVGIERLGSAYYSQGLSDDSDLQSSKADEEEKDGNVEKSAKLRKTVLEGRLRIFENKCSISK